MQLKTGAKRLEQKSAGFRARSGFRRLTGTLALGGLAAISPAASQSLDPVLDRQLVMQQLDRDAKALGLILAGIEPAEGLAARTSAIAKGAKEARDAFQDRQPGGSTLPQAWENWDDFSRRLDEFAAKADEMARIGQSGNVTAVNEVVLDAMPCKQCHELYRSRKES
jgi:cytochrome c556